MVSGKWTKPTSTEKIRWNSSMVWIYMERKQKAPDSTRPSPGNWETQHPQNLKLQVYKVLRNGGVPRKGLLKSPGSLKWMDMTPKIACGWIPLTRKNWNHRLEICSFSEHIYTSKPVPSAEVEVWKCQRFLGKDGLYLPYYQLNLGSLWARLCALPIQANFRFCSSIHQPECPPKCFEVDCISTYAIEFHW